MAVFYIGADAGDQFPSDLTTGTSTTSKIIELAITYTDATISDPATGRQRVLIALEAITERLEMNTSWPPA